MFTDEALCLGVGSSLEKIFMTFSSAVCPDSPAFTRLLDLDEATFCGLPLVTGSITKQMCNMLCLTAKNKKAELLSRVSALPTFPNSSQKRIDGPNVIFRLFC